jgi:hypothetical protein
MKTSNVVLLSAVDGGVTEASAGISVGFYQDFTVHAFTTGTAAGTLVIQGSNDVSATPSNWADVASTSAAMTSSTPYLKSVSNAPFEWIRVSYSGASGTGNLTARLKASGYY